MTAYYNEIDPYNAVWLKELISAGAIAPGDVDDRSIEDVTPNDLRGYVQCHFFAGIGVWSYALRQAGWPDDRPIWTGSCPCQPFSCAGKGRGTADERHLWPELFRLIKECRPVTTIGEQVAGKNGEAWLDLVQNDLEREDYRVGACVTAACGFGAPHIRKRIYWMADTRRFSERTKKVGSGKNEPSNEARFRSNERHRPADIRNAGPLADSSSQQNNKEQLRPEVNEREWGTNMHGGCSLVGALANDQSQRRNGRKNSTESARWNGTEITGSSCALADNSFRPLSDTGLLRQAQYEQQTTGGEQHCKVHAPGPVNGHWRDVDWLFCRDGLWRPTQSLSEPLVDWTADSLGYSSIEGRYSLNPLIATEKTKNRIMRLKGYGNAIVAQQAIAFIESIMEVLG